MLHVSLRTDSGVSSSLTRVPSNTNRSDMRPMPLRDAYALNTFFIFVWRFTLKTVACPPCNRACERGCHDAARRNEAHDLRRRHNPMTHAVHDLQRDHFLARLHIFLGLLCSHVPSAGCVAVELSCVA